LGTPIVKLAAAMGDALADQDLGGVVDLRQRRLGRKLRSGGARLA
jgi:hypothetical protein